MRNRRYGSQAHHPCEAELKALKVGALGGLECLKMAEMLDPGTPAGALIRVHLRAMSLKYHDYRVVGAANQKHVRRRLDGPP